MLYVVESKKSLKRLGRRSGAGTPPPNRTGVESQDVKIEPKDKVEIKGSRVTFGGKPAIIAAEVKKGERALKLRDENGVPVWVGWRRS